MKAHYATSDSNAATAAMFGRMPYAVPLAAAGLTLPPSRYSVQCCSSCRATWMSGPATSPSG